jgi:death-on-curing protein
MDPIWVPIDAVIDLHAEQIAEHGGGHGLRDRGLLESALARPQQRLAYNTESQTLVSLAAAYAAGLSQNHPFTDGNKRIAFLTMVVFLELNGLSLDAREDDAFEIFTRLASGDLAEPALCDWISENLLARDTL